MHACDFQLPLIEFQSDTDNQTRAVYTLSLLLHVAAKLDFNLHSTQKGVGIWRTVIHHAAIFNALLDCLHPRNLSSFLPYSLVPSIAGSGGR